MNGYIIDTSNNPNGGETISGGLDTGVIAFDGRPFTIHMVFKLNPSSQSTNTNVLFSAMEQTSNNKYSGFAGELYQRRELILFGGENTQIKNASFGSRISGTRGDGQGGTQYLRYYKTNGGVQTITINVTYIPASLQPEWKLEWNTSPLYTSDTGTTKQSTNMSKISSNSEYIPTSLSNATVTVGSYGVEHSHDAVNMEVLEFTVTKL